MTTLTADEAVRRVKAALAEMGWGDATVTATVSSMKDVPFGMEMDPNVPDAIFWSAIHASGQPHACWSCWHWRSLDTGKARACIRGNCTAGPDEPRTPPRELLVSR